MPKARSLRIALAGMAGGFTFFSLDLWADLYLPDSTVLHALLEAVELLILGPGVGLACSLLWMRVMEARRDAAAAEQARRLEWLGRLAATMAHEVRNPLHTARLAHDALGEEVPGLADHPLRRDLDRALERIDGAVALMYRLARPGSDAEETCDLADILTQLAQAQGVAITSLGAVAVRGSPTLVRTAVDNLLRNAIEASAPAQVDLAITHPAPDRVALVIRNPGLLPPDLGQRDMATVLPQSHKDGGLGLGVAIAGHIAQRYDGTLTLRQDGPQVVATLELPEAGA